MAKQGLELEITELRLGLPGGGDNKINEKKRVFSDISADEANATNDDRKIHTKSQVVGWPPVCTYRKKNSFNEKDRLETSKMYVKVSMDGAPFLRKIDLGMHRGYSDLAMALEKLFGCFGISEALKNADSSEFVPIYEDKDGDWMLAGDVPWDHTADTRKILHKSVGEMTILSFKDRAWSGQAGNYYQSEWMFIESCKRLRIMKRSEAKGFGLQPRGGLKGISKNEK